MSDLAELLDETEAVECQFLGKTVIAHVYTAGNERLTKEDREALKQLDKQAFPDLAELSDEEFAALSEEQREERQQQQWARYANSVDALRVLLPFALKEWELDGTAMTLRGEPFPPTAENIKGCPDPLLLALGGPVVDKWNKANPTNGAAAPTGLSAEEKQESSPTESITSEGASA